MLCDTNIISELSRLKPDPGVLVWSEGISEISISVITLEEIRFGLAWKNNERIQRWFEVFLEEHCEVLPVTDGVAGIAGEFRGQLQAKGQTRSQADMLIAATALAHGHTLVTRNIKDFDGCGIRLLNPFSN